MCTSVALHIHCTPAARLSSTPLGGLSAKRHIQEEQGSCNPLKLTRISSTHAEQCTCIDHYDCSCAAILDTRSSMSSSFNFLKGRGMASRDTNTVPSLSRTSNVPFLGFSGFISTAASTCSRISFSSSAARRLNAPQDLQASIVMSLETLFAAGFSAVTGC